MRTLTSALVVAVSLVSVAAASAVEPFAVAQVPSAKTPAQTAPMVAGEVVKVDSSAQKITLKHGPIPQLEMNEGMTMVFSARDPALLKGVKAGDKVKFAAERVNGQLTVTKIEKAKSR